MDKVIDGIDLSGQKTLHGLTLEQFYVLMKHQEFKCALSGFKFRYCDERKKYLDYQYPNGKKQIAPAIDHDHETGLIRGILSERVNQLTDQWHKWKAYGKLSEPNELIEPSSTESLIFSLENDQTMLDKRDSPGSGLSISSAFI